MIIVRKSIVYANGKSKRRAFQGICYEIRRRTRFAPSMRHRTRRVRYPRIVVVLKIAQRRRVRNSCCFCAPCRTQIAMVPTECRRRDWMFWNKRSLSVSRDECVCGGADVPVGIITVVRTCRLIIGGGTTAAGDRHQKREPTFGFHWRHGVNPPTGIGILFHVIY